MKSNLNEALTYLNEVKVEEERNEIGRGGGEGEEMQKQRKSSWLTSICVPRNDKIIFKIISSLWNSCQDRTKLLTPWVTRWGHGRANDMYTGLSLWSQRPNETSTRRPPLNRAELETSADRHLNRAELPSWHLPPTTTPLLSLICLIQSTLMNCPAFFLSRDQVLPS